MKDKKYKKRKLGFVPPEDWDFTNFGSVLEETQYGISTPEDSDGNHEMFKMNNYENGYMSPEGLATVSIDEDEFEKYRLNKGDLLFNRTNSHELVGKTGLFNLEGDYIFASYLIRLVLNDKKMLPKYANYYLNFNTAQQKLKVLATKGVSQSNINATNLRKHFHIAFPSTTQQKRIVDIFSSWDLAIEKIKDLISRKKVYKKGLMQQLLSGKKRFPEFEDEPWVEVKLGEVFNERKEKDCTHLDLVAITTDNGVIDRDKLDRKDTSSSNKDNYKRIAPGDIGYNTMRMWQGVSGYSELEGIVSPAYTIVTPIEDKVDGRFMSYLFKHPPIIDLFRRYSQGLVSDTLNLKYDNFAQIKVTIPESMDEQKKIRNTLLAADQEIDLLKEKLKAIKKQKKGLMQKLLTGKVRVNKELTKSESYA